MSKVNILPEEVVSKIAAGEVIERPASVIKECLENSLDAGSDTVEIHLKNAGKNLIHIKDNGSGIEQDDLEKIFLRHATSKIASSDDLFNIRSLGFRGEALYSIAAVADITLKSKTAAQDSGFEIQYKGGKKHDFKPCAFNTAGTELMIQELFFNTPARKKFLKSDTAEMNQILGIVIPYCLLYPEKRFLLTHQNKTALDLQPAKNITQRVSDCLRLEQQRLLEGESSFALYNCTMKVILGDINIQRSRRNMQYLFVNGRPVFNKNISYHMNQVYRLIMDDGVFPFFAVFLNVPAADVDVNIHPTKKEVKIQNENQICSLLRNLCEEILMKQGRGKQVPIAEHSSTKPSPSSFSIPSEFRRDKLEESFDFASENFRKDPSAKTSYFAHSAKPKEFLIPETASLFEEKKEDLQSRLNQSQYIGAFHNKYLLFQESRSLFLMDQHAAAERVNYEKILNQMQKGSIEVQNLLAPVLIRVSPQEQNTWEEIKETLNAFGFQTNQWDQETIAVHSHPGLIKNIECSVRNLLALDKTQLQDKDVIARRACRMSVMSGDSVNEQGAQHILNRLLNCFDPFTCPHGRPTVVELTEDFLDKQFLR